MKEFWSPTVDHPYEQIPLSAEVRKDLLWWVNDDNLTVSVPLQQSSPDLLLFLDASLEGWG
ncbi:MAG: hypothetical protein ACRDAX_01135, partial [Propionibacteriaceae bacterium]